MTDLKTFSGMPTSWTGSFASNELSRASEGSLARRDKSATLHWRLATYEYNGSTWSHV